MLNVATLQMCPSRRPGQFAEASEICACHLPMDQQSMGLEIVPMNISDAKEFVARHHRHHLPPVGALFAIGAAAEGVIVGAAIVGRPVARGSDDGWTAEVTRLATTGERNACSMLYRACWRSARAMGYKRLVTYTLGTEPGGSLRGAGFRCLGVVPGRTWSCKSRPRVDRHPTQDKLRWECSEHDAGVAKR